MNGMITFMIVLAVIMLVVYTIKFLSKQDPMDLFVGAFSVVVIFGLIRVTNYLREKNG